MKKQHLLLFVFCLLFATSSKAGNSYLSEFELANQLYDSGNFVQAKTAYLNLWDEGIISDDLHFNLGNAYFKTNEIARAILHYEKAIKINPANVDAAYNLKLANEKTVDKIESIPDLFIYRWWRAIYNAFAADNWAKIAITLFFLTALFFAVFLFIGNSQSKKTSFYLAVSSFTIAFFCWLMAHQQNQYLHKIEYAIILQPSVNIISAPTEGSSQLFVLHEGTKVKVKDETDIWLKVSLPNGNEGWLKKESIESI